MKMMSGTIHCSDIHFSHHQHGLLGINTRPSGKDGQSASHHQRYCPVIHDVCRYCWAVSTTTTPLWPLFPPSREPNKWRGISDGNAKAARQLKEKLYNVSIRHGVDWTPHDWVGLRERIHHGWMKFESDKLRMTIPTSNVVSVSRKQGTKRCDVKTVVNVSPFTNQLRMWQYLPSSFCTYVGVHTIAGRHHALWFPFRSDADATAAPCELVGMLSLSPIDCFPFLLHPSFFLRTLSFFFSFLFFLIFFLFFLPIFVAGITVKPSCANARAMESL